MYERGFKSRAERIAIRLRKSLGTTAVDPVDMMAVAEKYDIPVWYPEDIAGLPVDAKEILLENDSSSWSAITIDFNGKMAIILNSAHSKARQASNLAHEVSHIIIGHKGAQHFVDPNAGLLLSSYDKKEEDEANWLSGCLLLPREACIHIKKKKLSDAQATKKYGISKEMLNYRMNVTGVAKDFR